MKLLSHFETHYPTRCRLANRFRARNTLCGK